MSTQTIVHDFDFTVWRAEQELKRANRRRELRDAFASGRVVRQLSTIWSTAGVITCRDGIVYGDCIFIDAAQSSPDYLANHLENREYGFGFPTEILRATR